MFKITMIVSAVSSIVSNALPTVNAQVIFKPCPPDTCKLKKSLGLNQDQIKKLKIESINSFVKCDFKCRKI